MRLVGGNAVGLVLMIIGIFQITGGLSVTDQLGWLNLGLAGVGVCGGTNGLWLFHGRARIGRMQHTLLARRTGHSADQLSSTAPALVHAKGTSRYHLDSCPFVRGRPTRDGTEASFRRAGLLRCEICLPVDVSESTA